MDFLVDKIRLEAKVNFKSFQDFYNRCLVNNVYVSFYIGREKKQYNYNFKVNESILLHSPFGDYTDVNKFYIGYKHNSESQNKHSFNLVVEYNPNKCNIVYGLLNAVLLGFFSDIMNVTVKACDICCDFKGVSISNVVYDKNGKNKEKDYRESRGRTIYIGERGSNGSVKVYDKAAEQNISDYDWVRWETTVSIPLPVQSLLFDGGVGLLDYFDINLPTFYIGMYGIDCDDVLLRCIIRCVHSGHEKLSDLTHYYRKKITPYLTSKALYTVSNDNKADILKAIVSYIQSYFNIFKIDYSNNHILDRVLEEQYGCGYTDQISLDNY